MVEERDMRMKTLKSWYNDYRANHGSAPVEDMNQLSARLDLNHAHPSGIAQLFSSGHAHLDSLYRDNGMLKATERKLARVLEDKANKEHNEGTAQISLSVGSAVWPGHNIPILLYPIRVEEQEDGSLAHAQIRITGPATLNEALINALRVAGIDVEMEDILQESHSEGISIDSDSVFHAIRSRVGSLIDKFAIDNTLILGCFIRSSTLMLADADKILSHLEQGPTGNALLDCLNDSEEARQKLREQELPEYDSSDIDPHDEVEVGDVDNITRYAARVATSGTSIFVDLPAAYDSVHQAAAIASHAVMSGKSVLYAPGVSEQKRNFLRTMRDNDMDSFVVDIADSLVGASIDCQLISAVSFQPGSAFNRFNQLSDELVGVRGRLTKYLSDLHEKNDQWGVSAYETIENLARLSALPSHPSTHVRLSVDAARAIVGHEEEWDKKLVRAGELGEYTITAEDTPWFKASLYTSGEALTSYQRVERLLDTTLPAIRQHIATTAQTCGFPVPETPSKWAKQVHVLRNLRKVLDVFQPAIFERDIDSMIEATASKEERKESNSTMGYWERRRHTKEAKSLLRAGAGVLNLHDALVVVRQQADLWRQFVPRGGWPVLPPRLDDIIETQGSLERDVTALSNVLDTTPMGGNLSGMDFETLEKNLRALYNDRNALETLPERTSIEVELSAAGLDALIDDLRRRRVKPSVAPDELHLAWWTTVFESIVQASPIISNQDGSVLSAATERFTQVDTEHARSIGAYVHETLMKRLSQTVYAHSNDANAIHAALTVQPTMRYATIASMYPQITRAAKPIIVGMPVAVAAQTSYEAQIADVAIIDACAHIEPIELLSILARVRTVVVLAHKETVSSSSVKMLIDALPRVEASARLVKRDARLSQFLRDTGFGVLPCAAVPDQDMYAVTFTHVPANGVPSAASGIVETSRQEIEKVASIIEERASHSEVVPQGYKLTVVCLNDTHRQRVGAELKSLASKDAKLRSFLHHVAVITITDVAGMDSTDVIITMGFAKTTHGRLVQQFGALENSNGEGMLLDALALAHNQLDIVSSFTAVEMEDDRLHQRGPQLLKKLLSWAQNLDKNAEGAVEHIHEDDVLLNDLAERMRARGLRVAVNYGFTESQTIPLVVGLPGQAYALAVCTDDKNFMNVSSTRQRHRFMVEDLESLGWSVMYVWSVAAFVNPEKEVDRIVAYLARLSDEK
ncbi:helicase [Alloscardovia venturai]|uniref:Helicase n=1 Tax=Alloscardovia venturai TaxID=1769421 RepID=A0ABW2Y6X4_9BIFI